MAVLDIGPIETRAAPRTTQLTIRLFNSGKLPSLVGVEAYSINPAGDGFASETLFAVNSEDILITTSGTITGAKDAKVIDTVINDLFDPPQP